MKLSKVILENKKVVVRKQIDLTEQDISNLTAAITTRLQEYLDIEDKKILETTVPAAITKRLEKK